MLAFIDGTWFQSITTLLFRLHTITVHLFGTTTLQPKPRRDPFKTNCETTPDRIQRRQSRLPAWGRRQGAWREIDTNEAAYLIDCTMPAFIASLVAFCWDVVSVNVSHSIKTRTYCCALGNTWLFLEWLWVEYRIISCDLCTSVGDSTSLASVDSTLKYKSNSEARPWPPGCCAFQCLMQMVLWKCIRCRWRQTVAHTSKNLKSWV